MTHVTREPDRCVRENDVLRRRVAALEADAERFKATLRSINDAVIATDANGQVLQMNRMSEELTGWHEAEARGRPISEVFRIVNEETDPAGERSGTAVLGEVDVAGLAHHAVLITRDGRRVPLIPVPTQY